MATAISLVQDHIQPIVMAMWRQLSTVKILKERVLDQMQRRPTKTTRGPNADEKRYMAWVKQSCKCRACFAPAYVIFHHCEGATFKHNKTLIGHWFGIGLCQDCDSVVTHGSRRAFREHFGTTQAQLWKESAQEYEAQTDYEVPQQVKNAIADWGR